MNILEILEIYEQKRKLKKLLRRRKLSIIYNRRSLLKKKMKLEAENNEKVNEQSRV